MSLLEGKRGWGPLAGALAAVFLTAGAVRVDIVEFQVTGTLDKPGAALDGEALDLEFSFDDGQLPDFSSRGFAVTEATGASTYLEIDNVPQIGNDLTFTVIDSSNAVSGPDYFDLQFDFDSGDFLFLSFVAPFSTVGSIDLDESAAALATNAYTVDNATFTNADGSHDISAFDIVAVPEPGGFALVLSGAAAALVVNQMRRRKKSVDQDASLEL